MRRVIFMKNTIRDLTVAMLALGTTFGLGVLAGVSASAYVVFEAYKGLREDFSSGYRKDQDE